MCILSATACRHCLNRIQVSVHEVKTNFISRPALKKFSNHNHNINIPKNYSTQLNPSLNCIQSQCLFTVSHAHILSIVPALLANVSAWNTPTFDVCHHHAVFSHHITYLSCVVLSPFIYSAAFHTLVCCSPCSSLIGGIRPKH